MPRILSISYDVSLLRTRELLLQSSGIETISVSNYPELLRALESPVAYDLCILGHSLPEKEKLRVFHVLKEKHPGAPVLEMFKFHPDLNTGITINSQVSPEEFIAAVSAILQPSRQR